ncbi:hypothetical protein Pelo_16088 [Pelomyxa schiedti]|nr:hypothetical protein Pelo_16088 [Pelomyxa schiedti]
MNTPQCLVAIQFACVSHNRDPPTECTYSTTPSRTRPTPLMGSWSPLAATSSQLPPPPSPTVCSTPVTSLHHVPVVTGTSKFQAAQMDPRCGLLWSWSVAFSCGSAAHPQNENASRGHQ